MVLKVVPKPARILETGILTNKQRQRGFTLIEIMVVVVIAAVMVSLVGIRINRDNDRIASLEANRFMAILNEVRDEALLTGRVYALQFNQFERSYQFYTNPSAWQEIKGDRLFRERKFPEGITFEVDIEDIKNDDEPESEDAGDAAVSDGENEENAGEDASGSGINLSNYILISPVEELTPFSLVLIGDDYRYQVALNDEQRLALTRL